MLGSDDGSKSNASARANAKYVISDLQTTSPAISILTRPDYTCSFYPTYTTTTLYFTSQLMAASDIKSLQSTIYETAKIIRTIETRYKIRRKRKKYFDSVTSSTAPPKARTSKEFNTQETS